MSGAATLESSPGDRLLVRPVCDSIEGIAPATAVVSAVAPDKLKRAVMAGSRLGRRSPHAVNASPTTSVF